MARASVWLHRRGAGRQRAQAGAPLFQARHFGFDRGQQAVLGAGSGHAPFLEERQRFNRDLARFADAAQAGRGAADGR
jgi:hypothetical protein